MYHTARHRYTCHTAAEVAAVQREVQIGLLLPPRCLSYHAGVPRHATLNSHILGRGTSNTGDHYCQERLRIGSVFERCSFPYPISKVLQRRVIISPETSTMKCQTMIIASSILVLVSLLERVSILPGLSCRMVSLPLPLLQGQLPPRYLVLKFVQPVQQARF